MGPLRDVGAMALFCAAALLLTSCAPDGVSAPPTTADQPSTAPSTETAEPRGGVLVDFEHLAPGEGVFSEGADVGINGGVSATVRTGGGPAPGVAAVEGREPGSVALQFPEPCEGDGCSKLIVEIPPEDAPAFTGRVAFGVVLRLADGQKSTGANVLQRGFSTGDRGQWKLQVDGELGRPSCVVIPGGGETYQVRATSDIADGEWHEVSCERVNNTLSVVVDGQPEMSVPVDGPLVVAPEGPVRIGGKNVKPDNDQFHGAVDEVFFETS